MSILISYGGRRCHEMYDCTEIETMSMSSFLVIIYAKYPMMLFNRPI